MWGADHSSGKPSLHRGHPIKFITKGLDYASTYENISASEAYPLW